MLVEWQAPKEKPQTLADVDWILKDMGEQLVDYQKFRDELVGVLSLSEETLKKLGQEYAPPADSDHDGSESVTSDPSDSEFDLECFEVLFSDEQDHEKRLKDVHDLELPDDVLPKRRKMDGLVSLRLSQISHEKNMILDQVEDPPPDTLEQMLMETIESFPEVPRWSREELIEALYRKEFGPPSEIFKESRQMIAESKYFRDSLKARFTTQWITAQARDMVARKKTRFVELRNRHSEDELRAMLKGESRTFILVALFIAHRTLAKEEHVSWHQFVYDRTAKSIKELRSEGKALVLKGNKEECIRKMLNLLEGRLYRSTGRIENTKTNKPFQWSSQKILRRIVLMKKAIDHYDLELKGLADGSVVRSQNQESIDYKCNRLVPLIITSYQRYKSETISTDDLEDKLFNILCLAASKDVYVCHLVSAIEVDCKDYKMWVETYGLHADDRSLLIAFLEKVGEGMTPELPVMYDEPAEPQPRGARKPYNLGNRALLRTSLDFAMAAGAAPVELAIPPSHVVFQSVFHGKSDEDAAKRYCDTFLYSKSTVVEVPKPGTIKCLRNPLRERGAMGEEYDRVGIGGRPRNAEPRVRSRRYYIVGKKGKRILIRH
jgi:hypothetical protein